MTTRENYVQYIETYPNHTTSDIYRSYNSVNKNREGDQKSRQSLCVLGYVYSLSGLYFLIVLLTSFQCFQSEVCVCVRVCVCVWGGGGGGGGGGGHVGYLLVVTPVTQCIHCGESVV